MSQQPQQQPRLLSTSDLARGHAPVEPEQCLILRLPPATAERLRTDIEAGAALHDRLSIEAKPDLRSFVLAYEAETLPGRLLDLPCVVEAHKTADSRTFYKVANISQMLVCGEAEDGEAARRERKPVSAERASQWDHGLTQPLKNVRRRRFRLTRRNRFMDMPELEKEVRRLLRQDAEASEVKWQVLTEEEAAKLDSATSSQQQSSQLLSGGRSAAEEENSTLMATQLFGDISDSEEASDSDSDDAADGKAGTAD